MATDAQLVKACLDGQIEAFSGLVERYRDAIYGLCYARVSEPELAKDLTQETLVSAYRALRQLRTPERFAGWLRRIAENTCRASRRRGRVQEQVLDGQPLRSSEDLAGPLTTRLAVQAALRSLPQRCRIVLSLFYIGDYTCEEIARFLSVPRSTIKGRLRDARARLRGQLVGMVSDVLRKEKLPPDFGGRVMQQIRDVRLRTDGQLPVMLLRDQRGKALPVWIGEGEANALWLALEEKETARPMTYDLFLRALSAFGIRLERVEVADIRENTFFATVVLTKGKQQESLDARPSDAVNMALRARAPILVSDALVKNMVRPAEAEKRFHERTTPSAGAEHVVSTILERAAAKGAGVVSIRQQKKPGGGIGVSFVVGRKRENVMMMPAWVMTAVRTRLAELAGIKVKPGAKRQTGRIRTQRQGNEYEFKVTFTPSAVTLKAGTRGK